ncbi:MAG: hypothetical protein JO102_03320, partial [Elusimicrobia bacterium]|nr:hypothetical protein [Elusimicrobiota bacterium]
SFETQIWERAPVDAQTPFGNTAGLLRQRKTTVGVSAMVGGKLTDTPEREEEIYFDGDRNVPPFLAKAAAANNRPKNLNTEIGRVVYEVGPGGRRAMVGWVNAGLEITDAREGQETTLVHLVEIWPDSFTRNHWIDRQGRDWRERKLGGTVSHDDNRFDLTRPSWTWISTGSRVNEKLPAGFKINNGAGAQPDNVPSTVNKPGREILARQVFPDAPAHMILYEVQETPTKITGDPRTQSSFSYYDGNGRLWAQVFSINGTPMRSIAYYPQLGVPLFEAPVNNQVKFGKDATDSDFVYFFAQGGNVDDFQVTVTDNTGKSVTLGRGYLQSPHGEGLYSPEYTDPFVEVTADSNPADGNKSNGPFRIVAAQALDGLGRLFPVSGRPRSVFIPVRYLKDQGINVANMTITLVGANGVTVTEAQRAGDPNGVSQWQSSPQARERFFPAGEPYEKIQPFTPSIAEREGVVTVRRGTGTREQVWVYDHNVPISLSYWQKSGEVYDLVRIRFFASLSDHLRVPEYQEAGFANWLSGVVTIEQYSGGRVETIVGAQPPAVTRRLYPNGSLNFQNPVSMYLPFGFSDPRSPFGNITGNPVSAVLLRMFPDLHSTVDEFIQKWKADHPNFVQDFKARNPGATDAEAERAFNQAALDSFNIFDVAPEKLSPLGIRRQLLKSSLNVPLSVDARDLPQAAPVAPGAPALADLQKWADTVTSPAVWPTNPATGQRTLLPMTHPGTIREQMVDSTELSDILEGLAMADRLDDALAIANFLETATNKGTRPLLSGYTTGGQPVQWNPEWRAPGVGVERAEPTVRAANALLRLAGKLSARPAEQARIWALANQLATTSTHFVPDTDFLRSNRPVQARAETLVGVYRGIVDPRQQTTPVRDADFTNKVAAVELILDRAQRELSGPLASTAEVQAKRAAFIEELVAALAQNPGEAESLRQILRATGGITDLLPTPPVLLPGPSIVLAPEADVYETVKEALQLLRGMETALTANGGPFSERE